MAADINYDVARKLMPPPPPRVPKRKVEVMEEEEYMQVLEAIVERDYFPDIPKLQNKLEWMEAVKSGDPALIKQAQLNIARRRAGLKTPALTDAPTPSLPIPSTNILASNRLGTPALTPLVNSRSDCEPVTSQPSTSGSTALPVSLDTFLHNHTSEDNDSFNKILEENNKRKRLRYQHLLEDKNQPLLLEGPHHTDEYGTSGQQPGTLLTWHHDPKNRLYYDSSEQALVPLTTKEISSLVQGPPKAVISKNTRLAEDPNPLSSQSISLPSAPLPASIASSALPGSFSHPSNPNSTPGYNVLATPSYTPGVDASPFMTWGDIESTPLRLDADEDIPLNPAAASGPQFSLAPTPAREQAAMALASKAGKSLKAKAAGRSGTSSRQVGASTPLSAAGQKLVSVLRGTTGGDADKQLRASYRRTPLRTGTPLAAPPITPLLAAGTPKVAGGRAKMGALPVGPGAGVGSSKGGSITDGLLKL